MALWRCGLLVSLAALPLAAATIDVTAQPSLLLRPGDAIEFTFSSGSYRARTGLAPERLGFMLASLPFAPGASFTATLESSDRSLSAAFGSVAVASGSFHGSLYRGAISAISGSLEIPSGMASVFSGPAALLVLRNTGAEVTLGVPPYALSRDLSISLSRKGISVGGTVVAATLETAPQADTQLFGRDEQLGSDGGGEPVPEPRTLALVAAGGALLFVLIRRLRPIPHAGIQ